MFHSLVLPNIVFPHDLSLIYLGILFWGSHGVMNIVWAILPFSIVYTLVMPCTPVTTLVADFFDGSTLGRSLFHRINKKMQLTAKNVELHHFTKHWCIPIQAVCLIVALSLSRAK